MTRLVRSDRKCIYVLYYYYVHGKMESETIIMYLQMPAVWLVRFVIWRLAGQVCNLASFQQAFVLVNFHALHTHKFSHFALTSFHALHTHKLSHFALTSFHALRSLAFTLCVLLDG